MSPLDITIGRALTLSRSFNRTGREALGRRAYQVAARLDRGPAKNRDLMAHRSLSDIESSERAGVGRAARRRGVTCWDVYAEIFDRQLPDRKDSNPYRPTTATDGWTEVQS